MQIWPLMYDNLHTQTKPASSICKPHVNFQNYKNYTKNKNNPDLKRCVDQLCNILLNQQ